MEGAFLQLVLYWKKWDTGGPDVNYFWLPKEVTYDSIYDRPFNESDVLVPDRAIHFLDRISQGIRPHGSSAYLDAAVSGRSNHWFHRDRPTPAISRWLSWFKAFFKNIKLLNYVNEYDPDVQKQFAAMTHRFTMDVYLVVSRDGWHFDRLEGRLPLRPIWTMSQLRGAQPAANVMKEFLKALSSWSPSKQSATYACFYLPIICLNGSMTSTATMLLAPTGPLSRPKVTSGRPVARRFVPHDHRRHDARSPWASAWLSKPSFGGFVQHDALLGWLRKINLDPDQTSPDSQQTDETLKRSRTQRWERK